MHWLIFIIFFFTCRPEFQIQENHSDTNSNLVFEEIQFIKPSSIATHDMELDSIKKDASYLLTKQNSFQNPVKMKLMFYCTWDDYISGYYKPEKTIFYTQGVDKKNPYIRLFLPGLIIGLWMFYGILPIVPRAGRISIYLDASVRINGKELKFQLEEHDYYSSFYYGIYKTQNIEDTFQRVYFKTLENFANRLSQVNHL